jgi:hypothetical protein
MCRYTDRGNETDKDETSLQPSFEAHSCSPSASAQNMSNAANLAAWCFLCL